MIHREMTKPTDGQAGATRRPSRFLAVLAVLAIGPLLAWLAAPVSAQAPLRLWAAQTGPDQVTVAWDSIPGTLEYRIYVGMIGQVDEHSQAVRMPAGTRRATLTGMQRLSAGIYLLAAGVSGRVLQRAQFNPVTAPTSYSPIAPPAEVTAEATGSTEVTLTWNPAPGATAYYIGRAVGGSGVSTLCDLWSTEARYVDRTAMLGFPHTYTVSAIFPWGRSRAVASNAVSPGVTEVATTSGLTTSGPTASIPAGVGTGTSTTTTQTQTNTSPSGAAPIQDAVTGVVGGVSGIISNVLGGGVAAPTGVAAVVTGPGAVRVTWQPSATAGVTEYRLSRRVNGGAWELLNTSGTSTLSYSDAFFPVTMFATGTARVSYNVVAAKSTVFSPPATTGELTVQPPVAGTAPTGSTVTACKLDYQRADNMWAAFGRPDGPLGTETISLSPAQDKVFITDWKYEKTRNDGSNYYGSHLRIATNGSSRTIRLQLRTLTLTGLVVFARTGSDTFWVRLDPGKSQQFQADLMEVFCEN